MSYLRKAVNANCKDIFLRKLKLSVSYSKALCTYGYKYFVHLDFFERVIWGHAIVSHVTSSLQVYTDIGLDI